MINFSNYNKAYGSHKVLSIPDLSISAGIHWIKGVNGSGKSTLMKSIAGIVPFDGNIVINGHDLKRNPIESRRQVAYSEAEPLFPVFLTASEILEFAIEVRKVNAEEAKHLVQYFEVDIFQDQATGGYSAGMLKKLALCLAFIAKSSWILLDEPFAFIDNETEKKLVDIIKLKKKEGINFIITSHHELDHGNLDFDGNYRINKSELIEIQ